MRKKFRVMVVSHRFGNRLGVIIDLSPKDRGFHGFKLVVEESRSLQRFSNMERGAAPGLLNS